ncbi:MAG: hypothetical protein LBT59_23010 [Clostridiales bacterium]|nr:hypothetical protein [Clostridiales bacterium]
MTEQELKSFVAEVEDLLQSLKLQASEAISHIDSGSLLPDPLIGALSQLLVGLKSTQETALKHVMLETGETDVPRNIASIRQALERHYENVRGAEAVRASRKVFSRFLRIYSSGPDYQEDLDVHKRKISAYDDDALKKIDFETEVQPYDDFHGYVLEPSRDVIAAGSEKLLKVFGDRLVLALFLKRLYVQELEASEAKKEEEEKEKEKEEKPETPKLEQENLDDLLGAEKPGAEKPGAEKPDDKKTEKPDDKKTEKKARGQAKTKPVSAKAEQSSAKAPEEAKPKSKAKKAEPEATTEEAKPTKGRTKKPKAEAEKPEPKEAAKPGKAEAKTAKPEPELKVSDAEPEAAKPDAIKPEPAAIEPEAAKIEPEPIAVQEEPVVIKAEPEPVVIEAEPEPVVVIAEPEPVVVEAEPEPVVIKTEPVAAKAEPVVIKTEPDPVVIKTEPIVTKKAEPVVPKKAEPVVAKAEPVVPKKAEPVVAKAEPVATKKAEPVVAKAEPVVAKPQEEPAPEIIEPEIIEIEEEAPPEPDIPKLDDAFTWDFFSSLGLGVPDSKASYGKLKRVGRKGGPKAASTLQKSIGALTNTEREFVLDLAKSIIVNPALNAKLLASVDRGREMGRSLARWHEAFNFFHREGYLCEYKTESDATESIFGLSSAGAKLIDEEPLRGLLINSKAKIMVSREILTPAEYVRCLACVKAAESLCLSYSIMELDWTINENDGFYSLSGLLRKGKFTFLPVSFCMDDSLRDFQKTVGSIAEFAPATLVIAADTMEEAEKWAQVIGTKLSCPIFYGCLPEDKFVSPSGDRVTLPGCFVAKKAEPKKPKAEPKPEPKSEPKTEQSAEDRRKQKIEKKARKEEQAVPEEPIPEPKPEPINESSAKELARIGLDACAVSELKVNPIPIAIQLLKEDRHVEAAVLLQAVDLCKEESKEGWLCASLFYALDLPFTGKSYSLSGLAFMDFIPEKFSRDEVALAQYARVAAFARAFAFPDSLFDYELFKKSPAILEGLPADLADGAGKFLSLFTRDATLQSFQVDGKNFSLALRDALRAISDRKDRLRKLVEQAKELVTVPSFSYFTGSDDFCRGAFGPTSDLGKLLAEAAEGKLDNIPEFRKFVSRFDNKSGTTEWISKRVVEDYIDEVWAAVKAQNSEIRIKALTNENLLGTARSKFAIYIEKRLRMLREWIQLEPSSINEFKPSYVYAMQEIASKAVEQAEKFASSARPLERAGVEGAGASILVRAFSDIASVLSGEEPDKTWQFVPLLRTPYLHLDNQTLRPTLMPEFKSIRGFEPWRMAVKAIAADPVEPLDALNLIESDPSSDWYDECGTAVMLEDYLQETTGRTPLGFARLIEGATVGAVGVADNFEKTIRLSYAYGKIDHGAKETIFKIYEAHKSAFLASQNFGFFRAFLKALENYSTADTPEKKSQFIKALDQLAATENIPESTPMLDHIRKAIEQENFSLAEEYRTRLLSGETEISASELKSDAETDFFARFLQIYPALHHECNRDDCKGTRPSRWGMQALHKVGFSWATGNEQRNAEHLLSNWITKKGDPQLPLLITNFLNALGFTITNTANAGTHEGKLDVFKCTAVPLEKGLKDYEHPVFKYGTGLGGTINVVCLFGLIGATTINNMITTRLQLNGPTIVLNDGIVSTFDRNSLAMAFKCNTSGQNSYLFIDRVLLMFLASLNVGDRMVALLRCTLPYTYEQLYTTGVGVVSDEMFIGRIAERNAICSETGPSLVYGGRQLGKTALLRRAKNIMHHPKDRMYAVYLEVKDKLKDELLVDLKKELSFAGFTIEASSIEEFCDRLRELYEAKAFASLQIFIDEVDAFFEEDCRCGYKTLNIFIGLMRRSEQKIKFVFAGLHNVAHTHSALKNNGVFGQFNKAVCVAPLSPKDARALIERPLAYLGFSVGEDQLALILAYTNSYPGLLHLFCASLVQLACENYNKYYKPNANPPYSLTEEQIKDVFKSGGMEAALSINVKSTINDLDERYRVISNLVAFLTIEDKKNGVSNLYGYSPSKIKGEMNIAMLNSLSSSDFEVLLTEMTDMGILWSKPGSGLYRLRNDKFLEIIGSEDEITDCIVSASDGKEAT